MGNLSSVNDDHSNGYLAAAVISFYSIIKKKTHKHNDGVFRDSPELRSGLSVVSEEEKPISNLQGEDEDHEITQQGDVQGRAQVSSARQVESSAHLSSSAGCRQTRDSHDSTVSVLVCGCVRLNAQ